MLTNKVLRVGLFGRRALSLFSRNKSTGPAQTHSGRPLVELPRMSGKEPLLAEDGGYFGAPGVLRMTLNRPDKRNALNFETLRLFDEYLTALKEQGDCSQFRAVIIQANGPAFCSGHDLKEMMQPENDTPEKRRELFDLCSRVMMLIEQIPQPVITAVHGLATAAGCQLVAASDLTIATPSSEYCTPGVKIGLFCSTPSVPLFRCVGKKAAMDMLLTGRKVEADEALAIGLITEITEGSDSPEDAVDLVHEVAFERARQIAASSGPALAIGKQQLQSHMHLDLESAYKVASEAMTCNMGTADAHAGINAFLEKKSVHWEHK